MLPRGVAISNTRHLSSSETRINAGIRAWKSHLSESAWCQESVGGICFINKWRAASLQPLTFSNHCKNALFSNASPGLTVGFFGVNIGVFWKRESRPIKWRRFCLSTRQLFFVSTSIVYVAVIFTLSGRPGFLPESSNRSVTRKAIVTTERWPKQMSRARPELIRYLQVKHRKTSMHLTPSIFTLIKVRRAKKEFFQRPNSNEKKISEPNRTTVSSPE